MVLRAVFFDFDETLVDFDHAAQTAAMCTIEAAANQYGLLASDLLAKFFQIRGAYLERTGQFWGTPLRDFRQQWFRDALACFAIKDQEVSWSLADRYSEQIDELLALYPDVERTLDLLSQRYLLGVISDGWRELQGVAIARLRLQRFLRTIILAEEVGVEKPDPQIFHLAVSRIGCQVAEAVHVGDSLVKDVGGAKRAGLMTVWVNRTGGVLDPRDPQPHHVVSSLLELSEWLERLSQTSSQTLVAPASPRIEETT